MSAPAPRPHGVRRVAPQFRVVAVPAAIALGAVGGIAAERVQLSWIVGALGGALAAALTVLALPSLPTRRATVVLLGVGGLGALRHASFAGTDRSWLLVVWAVATLVTLVLVDRADAEASPPLAGGRPLNPRGTEAMRVSAVIALIAVVVAVALVPTVTARLGRHVWPGVQPNIGDAMDAPASLDASNELDITSRPRLTDKVVFTVDASRPDFWRGATFDSYSGSSWRQSAGLTDQSPLDHDGSTVQVPAPALDPGAQRGVEFRQTYHFEGGFSNVLFAAPTARVVETDKPLLAAPDGTLRVADGEGNGFGRGAVYTVVSRAIVTTETTLRAADAQAIPATIDAQYAQPNTSERVRSLARQIVAGQTTAYDKIRALEHWMGDNTQYSLNAPTAPSGVDVVDDFLFRSKLGWCEQIASSLVEMARSVGIPARLVTGFVPEDRDALTGRFVVRERDAHAWAEIYFAGIGWQGFDPTASVPLAGNANPDGSWLQFARHHAIPLGIAVALIVLAIGCAPQLVACRRRRRERRASWSAHTLYRLERIGRKVGRARAPAETPREYAHALAERLHADALDDVGDTLDAGAFSEHGVPAGARDAADAVLSSLRP